MLGFISILRRETDWLVQPGGAAEKLDYWKVVHVLIRTHSGSQALYQAWKARRSDHSAVGISDQECPEELVSGIRAKSGVAAGLYALPANVLG